MTFRLSIKTLTFFSLSLFMISVNTTNAQGKIKNMPGYDRYQKMSPQLYSSVQRISPNIKWSADGKTFTYVDNDIAYTFDVRKKKIIKSEDYQAPPRIRFSRQGRPARGRQYAFAISPDSTLKAFTKDRNMYISKPDSSELMAITSDGNEDNQVKYGCNMGLRRRIGSEYCHVVVT